MLSQIRHIQKGVLIVVSIIIIIAFAFLYSDYDAGARSGNTSFVIYDRAYRTKEAQVLANSYQVAMGLGLFEFAGSLFGEQRQDSDLTDFVLNLVILREEAKRLGVQPSPEQVKKAIPNLPIFTIRSWVGEDDIRNNITGPAGFTDANLYQLVKDYLSWQQIRELLAAGIEPIPEEIDRIYIRDFQRISGSVIAFSREEVEKELKITDKEIEDYYNEHKDSDELLSQESRSGSYVHLVIPEEKEGATNEQKAEHALAFNKVVAAIYEEMAADGADFAKVAEKHKLELAKTGEVTLTDIPKELEEKTQVLRALFSVNKQQPLSTPVRLEDGSYYILHLDELKEPQPQSLEDASVAIRKVLKTRKAGEQVQARAAKAQAAINEALAAGKSFPAAAKAAGVEAVELPPFSNDDPPKETDNARLIVDTGMAMEAGKLSGVVNTPTGAMLVYVDKKVVYESSEEEQRKDMIKGQLSYTDAKAMYNAWFQQQREKARPERSGPVASPQG